MIAGTYRLRFESGAYFNDQEREVSSYQWVEALSVSREWHGPHVFDPPSHFIVTANHKPVPADYPYFLSLEYHQPFRAQRITDLLKQQSSFTPDTFRDIQADRVSLHAQALLPLLLRHVHVEDTLDRQAVSLLTNWNFDASGGRAEPAIFGAWFLRLGRLLVEDGLNMRAGHDQRMALAEEKIVKNVIP